MPYLSGAECLKYIPLINVLWLVGRVTFFLGYPEYRCYGWVFSNYVNLAAVAYGMYSFLKLHLALV